MGVGTAGLVIGCFPRSASARRSGEPTIFEPSAYLKIESDGSVTVTVSKSDMGQGVRTTFAMLVAEELDADWTKVRVEQAPANPGMYGGQGTGGSGSIRSMHARLRQTGAAARSMLVTAAAQKWGVDASTCSAEDGKVLHRPTGRSATYGELAPSAAQLPVPTGILPLKPRSEFKILGKRTARVDNKDVVTGKAVFGMDATLEGAAVAVIARRPAFGASLASVDDAAARAVPGVLDVVRVNSGVAVLATNTWAALEGREALKLSWNPGPNSELDSAKLEALMRSSLIPHQGMPDGARTVDATFTFPFLAHATMEPMNAIADVREGRCTIWAPTQTPDSAQQQVARSLGIAPENVTINVTLLGGGFGRRLSGDYIMEAVNVSSVAKRAIRLVWTRDDDMRNDNYRPMSVHLLRGAIDAQGAPVGWSHVVATAGGRGRGGGGQFGNPGIPYAIPGAGMAQIGVPTPIPVGAWRSVEHTQLDVANECFVDELAALAGQDPFEFRRKLIRNERQKRVLETAAEKAGWGKPMPKGWGRGIACFGGYGSYAAHVVELEVKGDRIRVHKVFCAVDCGIALNPSGVEAQMQGACVDGLSTALKAEITIQGGGVKQSTFADYEWLRMNEMPKIDVTIIDGGGDPGGMGEVGYPSTPAAVANAVAAATGKRVRRFPIRLSEVV
jgi:isoquinoline 1-oxidoreductase beta subunit